MSLGLPFFGPNNFHTKYIWRRNFGQPLRKENGEVLFGKLPTSKTPPSSTPSTGDLGDSYHIPLHLGTQKFRDYSVPWIFQVPNREVFLTQEIKGALLQPTGSTHEVSTCKLQQNKKFKELNESITQHVEGSKAYLLISLINYKYVHTLESK